MRSLDPIVFGLILVAIAVVLIGIIALITRAFPKSMLARQKSISFPQINIDIPSSNDAVLLVQTGGRVIYANEKAYELFGKAEEPNLERLARRARPSDLFLGLCGKEGQARFSLDGRFIEGTSYYLPPSNGAGGAFLVSLRQPQVAAIASGEAELSNQALDIFAELSQQMASSLELETALHAIMESVERLIPSDFPEVTIWDSDNQNLIPYHFVGTPGIDQHLERSDERYTAEKGYSGYLITNRQPLLVEDVNTYLEVRPQVNQNQYPFNSYLGVPLLAAGELIGTLELASLNKGAFNQSARSARPNSARLQYFAGIADSRSRDSRHSPGGYRMCRRRPDYPGYKSSRTLMQRCSLEIAGYSHKHLRYDILHRSTS